MCFHHTTHELALHVSILSQSAHRALGIVIAKGKSLGGLPYQVFCKLYDSLVQPIIDYGACIWGARTYSCISSVQNRAMRFFLGVGRRTPVAALQGDMGWYPNDVNQWICIHCSQTMVQIPVYGRFTNQQKSVHVVG